MRIDAQNTWFLPTIERGPVRSEEMAAAARAGAESAPASTASAPPPPPPPASPPAPTDSGGEDLTKPEKSLLEKILEHGFSQFAADMEKEKLDKLREQILAGMGLTEEKLQQMPPEQRKQIEDLVAAEIRKRLEGMKAMNGDDEDQKGETKITSLSIAATSTTSTTSPPVTSAATPQMPLQEAQNTGLGVMLALQESETAKAERENAEGPDKLGKNDRDDA